MINCRNERLADLRRHLRDSVLLFGKNKLITLALGRTKEHEAKHGLHKLVKFIKGRRAFLFTDRDLDEMRDIFNQFRSSEFARPGIIAPQTVSNQCVIS